MMGSERMGKMALVASMKQIRKTGRDFEYAEDLRDVGRGGNLMLIKWILRNNWERCRPILFLRIWVRGGTL
jgi:hypothetical protein